MGGEINTNNIKLENKSDINNLPVTTQKKHSTYKAVVKRTVISDSSKKSLGRKSSSGYVKVKPYEGNEISLFSGEQPDFKVTGNHRITLPVQSPFLGNHTANQQARRFRNIKRNINVKAALYTKVSSFQMFKNFVKSCVGEIVRHLKKLDYSIVLCILVLSLCGIVAVHSATHSFGRARFDIMQIGMTVVGFIAMFVVSYFDIEKYSKNSRLLYALNVIVLLITIIFGVGPEGSGAATTNRNWLRIGPVGIQVSEFSKILFIFTLSVHISKLKDNINKFRNFLAVCFHAIIIISLVLLQKDLGMAIVYAAIFVGMLFCAKLSWKYILTAAGALTLSAPFIWSRLDNYQQKRILVSFNPELDPEVFGYQVIRSKIAIGAGGLTGSGYMQGAVSQSESFPAKQTDMIYAVICEEFGLIGAMVIIAIYALLIYRLFSLSVRLEKNYEKCYCQGIYCMLVFQIIENIGMCLGFMPVVGITLPFISYGGSSVLSLYIAFGILLAMSKNRSKKQNYL